MFRCCHLHVPGPHAVPGTTQLLLPHLLIHRLSGGTKHRAAALLIQMLSLASASLVSQNSVLSHPACSLWTLLRSTSFRKSSLTIHSRLIFFPVKGISPRLQPNDRGTGPGAPSGWHGLEPHLPAGSSSFTSYFLSFSSRREISPPGKHGPGLAPSQPTLEGDVYQMLMLSPNVGS